MKMKKLIAVLLSCMLILSTLGITGSAAKEGVDTSLQFGEDGKFTILNISDIQNGYPLNSVTKKYIIDTLDMVDPDLVVLTGDNIAGYSAPTKLLVKAAIKEFMDIFEERGVKVAGVYGNHDSEDTTATKEYQLAVYESYDCYIGCAGYTDEDRVGTYNLPILSSDGSKYAFNLWFTDSGTHNDENDIGGYGCVHKGQIEWYKKQCAALAAQNGGEVVPAINFQHIVVPEVYDAFDIVYEYTDGALSATDENGNACYYVLPDGAKGALAEDPCPPRYSNGQFDAMVEMGDVVATVSGHDHVNSYEVDYKGIKIINTPSMGFAAYNGENVGSRVFVLDENDARNFETYCLDFDDVYSDGNEMMKCGFLAYLDSSSALVKVVNWLKYVCMYAEYKLFTEPTEKITKLFKDC